MRNDKPNVFMYLIHVTNIHVHSQFVLIASLQLKLFENRPKSKFYYPRTFYAVKYMLHFSLNYIIRTISWIKIRRKDKI